MQFKKIAYTLLIAGTAAIVATSPSFAAKKKMEKSYADQMTPMCLQPHKAVCGMKGTQKFTYASACFAMKDGAKIVSDSACAGGKKMKKKMSMKKPMKKGDKAKKKM